MKKESANQFAVIIPARYASSRFPGKPLVNIRGKSMVQRVYEQSVKSVDIVYVATDDTRIYDEVQKFGGKAIMTSSEHRSGTDRCAEAVGKIMNETGKSIDIVVNVQVDEPFIKPEQIDILKTSFDDKSVNIATLVRRTIHGEDIFNPNQPKVVLDSRWDAIYFSRAAIPYIRDYETSEWSKRHVFFKHVGLYAYRSDVLLKITGLSRSSLEIAESLEQNRWIENGFRIRCVLTEWESIGIDTPDDLQRAVSLFDQFI